jgi:ice-binding like protein
MHTKRPSSPGRRAPGLPAALALAAVSILRPGAAAAPPPIVLGSAANFGVLAGAGITVAGAVDSTAIQGDIGSFPTPAITGLGNVVLTGTDEARDAATAAAKVDLLAAFGAASAATPTRIFAPVADLGGLTLTPGVYTDSSSFGLTGDLTLDALGDPDAEFIFQAGSTLGTAAASEISLIDGAQADNVFFEVGSSATLGAGSDFAGTILALTSITADTGVAVDGRLLTLNGAVTLDADSIVRPATLSSVPDAPGTLDLLGLGLVALALLGPIKDQRQPVRVG